MALPKTIHEFEWMVAVLQGNINRIRELLLSNNLKLNTKRYFDYYLIKEGLEKHKMDIVELLVKNGFRVHKKSKVNQEKTVLHAAVESSDDTELISTLLEKGAYQDIFASNRANKTPFHLVIDRNQLSIFKLFVAQFNVKTLDNKNLLHYAVEKDKIVLVTELIKEGLSINKKNEENLTPFCVALRNGNSRILNHLLSYCTGKMKNINQNNYNDVALVYIASICGYLKLIKKYVDLGLSINRPLMPSKEPWSCLSKFSGSTLLHLAVRHVQFDLVKFLLSLGANILARNNDRSTAVHIALETKEKGIWKSWQQFEDNNSIIDLILEANMKIKSNPVNKNKLSHFHIACSRDEPTVVEHFLKHGALIDQPTKPQCHLYKGFYPLHFAAKFRCIRTLELLLKNGADVKKRDFRKRTALHIAAQESCLDTVHLLLEYGADITSIDSDGNSPVHWAFKNKNYAILDLLLSVHNQVHSNPINSEGISHFLIACSRNNVQVVKSFVENGALIDHCVPVKPNDYGQSNITDWAGYSPLHFAVSHNRANIVRLLLENKASVEIKDSKNRTPLHLACQYTYEMFREFIRKILCDFRKREKVAVQFKPETDVIQVWETYFNGFNDCPKKINWLANRTEHLRIINTLLKYKSDVNCLNWRCNSPVFDAYDAVDSTNIKCMIKDNVKDFSVDLLNRIVESLTEELYERRKLILNNLLKMDVNINRCHRYGSILHSICSKKAADERDVEIMQLFLEHGADVNYKNKCAYYWKKFAPLHVATKTMNENLIKILLDYGANVNSTYYRNKRTPLLMAICEAKPLFNCANIMKLLISKGANVNTKLYDKKTPLHSLAMLGEPYFSQSLISVLINGGADINSQDNWGYTPLHIACSQFSRDIVEAFLLFGADINIEDYLGCGVCSYMYEFYLKNLSRNDESLYNMQPLIKLLQNHVIKMEVIGLPISPKELWSCAKFYDFVPRTDEEKKELIDNCEDEVQILRDTKINDYYSLYSVLFKKENALAKLVKNCTFKSIVGSKSFKQTYPNYGYLVQLTYQAGMDRAKLLPTARSVLYDLVGIHLPYAISEMIFSYFTNSELKESIQTVSSLLNSNKKSSIMQLRNRSTLKYQKVY